MKADVPLRVQVPADGDEQPSWVRVGVIAAVGFVIGVGWPRLVGARIGPTPPQDTATSATPASSNESAAVGGRAEGTAAPAASAAGTSPATPPSSTAAASAALPVVNVNHGVLLSCRNEDGQALKGVTACGGLGGFDAIVQPKLRKLATCPAANAATNGKLSIVFNLDFTSKRVAADVGKSSTVPDSDGFAACVKGAFQGVSLGALAHENPRYTIGYSVVFSPTDHVAPPSNPSSGPSDGVPVVTAVPSASTPVAAKGGPEDGNAEVAWDVAIVRDAPHTGAVVARLPRGTKVRLGPVQDGWYKVAYGGASAGEGWLYRGALGR